jgi:hypothetical protein
VRSWKRREEEEEEEEEEEVGCTCGSIFSSII